MGFARQHRHRQAGHHPVRRGRRQRRRSQHGPDHVHHAAQEGRRQINSIFFAFVEASFTSPAFHVCEAAFVRPSSSFSSRPSPFVCWLSHFLNSWSLLNNSFSASLTTYDGFASMNCAYLFNVPRTSSSSRIWRVAVFCFVGALSSAMVHPPSCKCFLPAGLGTLGWITHHKRRTQFATVNSMVELAGIRVPLIGDWSITAPCGHCGAVT